MKKIYLTFILSIIIFNLNAQDQKKNWSDGKLVWDDFTERSGGNSITELKYYLGFEPGKQKFKDTVILRNIAVCYIYKGMSWINSEYKTEQYLRYNQLVFDIVELHRRILQLELDKPNYYTWDNYSVENVMNSCEKEIGKLNKETDDGRDFNSLIFWENKIKDELAFYEDCSIPKFETGKFGYGLHVGFGSGAFTGTIKNHFTQIFNMSYGFEFAYERFFLQISGLLGVGNVTNNYFSTDRWYKNQVNNIAVIDMSLGYAFINNKNIKLTPYIGFGLVEISDVNFEEVGKSLKLLDYNFIFGLNLDYKIRTKIKMTPNFFGPREKTETSLRARFYISRANFEPNLKGYLFNFGLSYSLFGNIIR